MANSLKPGNIVPKSGIYTPSKGGAQVALSEGDRVVLTHGDHVGRGGGTNTLKLLSVGADGMVESLRDL